MKSYCGKKRICDGWAFVSHFISPDKDVVVISHKFGVIYRELQLCDDCLKDYYKDWPLEKRDYEAYIRDN